MKTFQYLQNELEVTPCGERVPYYFRYLGYREAPAATPAIARSNAVYALFAKTEPYIHPHELIAGNDKCLWADANQTILKHAYKIDQQYGSRNFTTNADHYTPNFEHTVEYKYAEMEPLSKKQVEPIKMLFEQAGFGVNIE